ncbi:MAG: tetratricopeptide repeat protein, partial [Promethearchaeota archaeon]
WRGYRYQLASRIPEAEDLHDKVLEVSKKLSEVKPNDSAQYLGRAYWFLARFYQDTDQWYEAEQAFRKAMDIINDFEPQDEEGLGAKEDYLAGTFHYLGLQLSLLYRLKEAEEYIRKAILIYEKEGRMPHYFSDAFKSGEQPLLLFAKNILAQISYQSGRALKAEAILREILDSSEESVITNMTLFRLAITLGFQHRWNEDLEIRRTILGNFEKLASKDSDFQISVSGGMGELCLPLVKTGQYQEAEKIFNRVIPEYRRLVEEEKPFSESLAIILQNFAILLGLTGNIHRAKDACLESIDIFRELVERCSDRFMHRLAAGLGNLSVILLQMGNTKEAQKTMQEAYVIAKEISLKHQEATSLAEVYAKVAINIGAFYEENENWSNAQRFLDEARSIVDPRVEIASEMFLPTVAILDNNLAILLGERKQFSDAESQFKDALEIRRNYVKRAENLFLPKVASLLNNLGILYRRSGRVDEAEETYKEAIELMEPFAEKEPKVHKSVLARILNNILVLYSEVNDSKSADSTRARLRRLGIKEIQSKEQWCIDIEYLDGY